MNLHKPGLLHNVVLSIGGWRADGAYLCESEILLDKILAFAKYCVAFQMEGLGM